jgi:hypothetical protein
MSGALLENRYAERSSKVVFNPAGNNAGLSLLNLEERTVSRKRDRGNRRLLNVAKALRESPAPEKFVMHAYGITNGCDTPACALGHYASRRDLQHTFMLVKRADVSSDPRLLWVMPVKEILGFNAFGAFRSKQVRDHFDISEYDGNVLFGVYGCGQATTPEHAADYIERFVADRSTAS